MIRLFSQHDRIHKSDIDEKTREEILSLIAHHVTAVNYIYRNTKFDGRFEHRNIRFEVSSPINSIQCHFSHILLLLPLSIRCHQTVLTVIKYYFRFSESKLTMIQHAVNRIMVTLIRSAWKILMCQIF